jgi:hypothetical protein
LLVLPPCPISYEARKKEYHQIQSGDYWIIPFGVLEEELINFIHYSIFSNLGRFERVFLDNHGLD